MLRSELVSFRKSKIGGFNPPCTVAGPKKCDGFNQRTAVEWGGVRLDFGMSLCGAGGSWTLVRRNVSTWRLHERAKLTDPNAS